MSSGRTFLSIFFGYKYLNLFSENVQPRKHVKKKKPTNGSRFKKQKKISDLLSTTTRVVFLELQKKIFHCGIFCFFFYKTRFCEKLTENTTKKTSFMETIFQNVFPFLPVKDIVEVVESYVFLVSRKTFRAYWLFFFEIICNLSC